MQPTLYHVCVWAYLFQSYDLKSVSMNSIYTIIWHAKYFTYLLTLIEQVLLRHMK